MLDVLRQDLTHAARQLRRAPGFALIAVLTLGLGIGGNAALFSLVDGVLFRPLPFRDPDRLVGITEENVAKGMLDFGISPANLRDLTTAGSTLFQAAAGYQPRSGTVAIDGPPDRVSYASVSGPFFRVFIDQPRLGRALRPDDDVPGSEAVVVSHAFWVTRLGGTPDAVGRTFRLDGVTRRVVGVMPSTFAFPSPATALWTPLGLSAADLGARGARFLAGVGRLAADVSVETADQALEAEARNLARAYVTTNDGWSAKVAGLRQVTIGDARSTLLLVWGAAGLILLIAAANVASLLLGRGLARQREMALRGALGAERGRLIRQTLTEGLTLAVLGGGLGLGIAALVLALVRRLGASAIPRLGEVGLDGRIVGFTGGLVLVTALLFSLAPALAGSRPDLRRAFDGGRGGPSSRRGRWQAGLVVVEVALAVVVLIGTGLIVRTMAAVLGQPLGFVPERVLTFRVEPPWRVTMDGPVDSVWARLETDRARIVRSYAELADRLRVLPGVTQAGAVNRLPLTGDWWITSADLADHPAPTPETRPAVYVRLVTPGYFEAMGTRIVEGRPIRDTDAARSERVVVIDRAFAERYWGDRSPIGSELVLDPVPGDPAPRARIVGVAEAIRMAGLETNVRPTMYLPLAQGTEGHFLNWGMDVVLRPAPSVELAGPIREIVREVLPDAAVFRVASMNDLIASSVADRRFQLLALGGFALVALVLTIVGVYGVLALTVRQRIIEYGVRLALGASPVQIGLLVERQGLALVGAGTGFGIVVALALSRLFRGLVYGISSTDVASFVAGPLLLGLVALVAGLVPAWQAARVDPKTLVASE